MRTKAGDKIIRDRKTARMRFYLRRLKSRTPCHVCEEKYPHYVMEYDHVRGKKLFNLSSGSSWVSWKALFAEVKKCDIVCANCHRRRTWRRRQQSGA